MRHLRFFLLGLLTTFFILANLSGRKLVSILLCGSLFLQSSACTINQGAISVAAEKPEASCRIAVALFQGYDGISWRTEGSESNSGPSDLSRTGDNGPIPVRSGVQQIKQKIKNFYADEASVSVIAETYKWEADDDAEKMIRRAVDSGSANKVVIIGHSYGADTANALADDLAGGVFSKKVDIDLLVQIDSIGTWDDNFPTSVKKAVNYYQTKDSEPLVETNIPGAENINASEMFNQDLDHRSIDNDPGLQNDIVQKISQYVCPPMPREIRQPREGKQRRGRNFGDPHLFTFDGHRYSFQDVGEFILAKSDDNFFEVQVRQSPISSALAVDSAIAMAVGDTRVALYADPKDLPDGDTSSPLRIDGKPVNLRKKLNLDNGGKVNHKGSAYVIEWPTKEKVVAQINSDSENPFLNLSVFVFESQADHIVGLLGNDNGKKEDDLRFRDGRVLPSRSTYGDLKNVLNRVVKVKLPIDPALNAYLKKLTKEYGNSWRISQKESLFDYAPGMTTASFTLKGFPSEYLTLSQLPTNLVSNAQKTCRQSGVEPEMMEGCVFDVAYSGYGGFARAAAQASQVMDVLEDLGIRVPRPRLPGGLKLPDGLRIPRLPW